MKTEMKFLTVAIMPFFALPASLKSLIWINLLRGGKNRSLYVAELNFKALVLGPSGRLSIVNKMTQ